MGKDCKMLGRTFTTLYVKTWGIIPPRTEMKHLKNLKLLEKHYGYDLVVKAIEFFISKWDILKNSLKISAKYPNLDIFIGFEATIFSRIQGVDIDEPANSF